MLEETNVKIIESLGEIMNMKNALADIDSITERANSNIERLN